MEIEDTEADEVANILENAEMPHELEEENPPRRTRAKLGKKAYKGYQYVLEKTVNGNTYMVCKHYRKGRCFARAIMRNGVFEPPTCAHICGSFDDEAENTEQFRKALRNGMNTKGTPRKVYDDERKKVEDSGSTGPENVPFAGIMRSMSRWKNESFPKFFGKRVFNDLEELHNALTSPKNEPFLAYNRGTDVVMINVDATFRTIPRLGNEKDGVKYQLLIIVVVIMDHSFPITWVIMSSRTEQAYTACFRTVLEPFRYYTGPIMCDFEIAPRNSLRVSLPSASLLGCLFHFIQALVKRAKKYQIYKKLKTDERGKFILRRFAALALLPSHLIERGFEIIKEKMPSQYSHIYQRFFNYFEYWLRRVEDISVYGQTRRTNNVSESNNAQMNHLLPKHPTAITFLREVIDIASKTQSQYISVQKGLQVTRRRVDYLVKQMELKQAWANLDAGFINIHEFLTRAAGTIHKFPNPATIDVSSCDEDEGNPTMTHFPTCEMPLCTSATLDVPIQAPLDGTAQAPQQVTLRPCNSATSTDADVTTVPAPIPVQTILLPFGSTSNCGAPNHPQPVPCQVTLLPHRGTSDPGGVASTPDRRKVSLLPCCRPNTTGARTQGQIYRQVTAMPYSSASGATSSTVPVTCKVTLLPYRSNNTSSTDVTCNTPIRRRVTILMPRNTSISGATGVRSEILLRSRLQ